MSVRIICQRSICMDIFKLKEQVNNYRKLQLYAIDDLTIKESIIYDLKQISHAIDSYCKEEILAKIIVYLEFGWEYQEHAELFKNILQNTDTSPAELEQHTDLQYRFPKANQASLREIIICSGRCAGCSRKGDIIFEILELIKYNKSGQYSFHCKYNDYCLIIKDNKYILKNLTKDIEYNLQNKVK